MVATYQSARPRGAAPPPPPLPGRATLARDGRITQACDTFAAYLGFVDGDELIDLPFDCLWMHDARPRLRNVMAAARSGVAMRDDLSLDYVLGDGAGACAAIFRCSDDGELRVSLRPARSG